MFAWSKRVHGRFGDRRENEGVILFTLNIVVGAAFTFLFVKSLGLHVLPDWGAHTVALVAQISAFVGQDALLVLGVHLGAVVVAALPLRPAHAAGLEEHDPARLREHRRHGHRARAAGQEIIPWMQFFSTCLLSSPSPAALLMVSLKNPLSGAFALILSLCSLAGSVRDAARRVRVHSADAGVRGRHHGADHLHHHALELEGRKRSRKRRWAGCARS